jgi:hypothetical protein
MPNQAINSNSGFGKKKEQGQNFDFFDPKKSAI